MPFIRQPEKVSDHWFEDVCGLFNTDSELRVKLMLLIRLHQPVTAARLAKRLRTRENKIRVYLYRMVERRFIRAKVAPAEPHPGRKKTLFVIEPTNEPLNELLTLICKKYGDRLRSDDPFGAREPKIIPQPQTMTLEEVKKLEGRNE